MKRITTIAVMIITLTTSGQYEKQQAQLLVTNILFGGVTSAVGSCINKNANQSYLNAFANGFWKGSIGGSICYTGKRLNYQIVKHENLAYGWPGKIVNHIGSSMMENGAYNRGFIEQFHIYLGPTRIDYNFKNNYLQTRLLVASFISAVYLVSMPDTRIDLVSSLMFGNLLFEYTADYYEGNGYALFNNIFYHKYHKTHICYSNYLTIAHEGIHIYQNEQFDVINSFYKPLNIRLKGLEKYIYVQDFWNIALYELETLRHGYRSNIFEIEAISITRQEYTKRK